MAATRRGPAAARPRGGREIVAAQHAQAGQRQQAEGGRDPHVVAFSLQSGVFR
jgi:hypothetical protein